MKITQLLTILFLFSGFFASAQDDILTGKVQDFGGEPLPGCNVYVENELNRALSGTITDVDGNFQLPVPEGDNYTIVFSFIGYQSTRIAYTGQPSISVTLQPDNIAIDDVQIVSQRVERNSLGLTDKELVTSTQKFNMDEMESTLSTSIEDAIQGRLANVDIISGGDPGSRSSIRIRGTSSLSASSEPLIVIDGVPYPTDIEDDFNFATANDEDFGALVNISPADIESIEVLKDAAATAIWGSDGANGVLIFNTKKGRRGKTRFSFSSKVDFKKEPNTIPMLNSDQYVNLIDEALFNSYYDVGYIRGLSYIEALANTPELDFDPAWQYFDEYNQETDWLDEVTQLGYTTDNNFSMSGGGDKAIYRVSLGYLNELGTTIGTDFERFSSLISIDYRFSDKLRITSNFSFSQSSRNSFWTGSGVSTPRGEAIKKMPHMSPYVIGPDGEMTGEYFTPEENFQGSWNSGEMYNPVAMVHESRNRTVGTNGRIIFGAIYSIKPGFEYHGRLGLDMRTNKNKRLLPNSVTGVGLLDNSSNMVSDNLSDAMYITTENKLIYRKTFEEKHKIIATGLVQSRENRNASYSSSGSGSPSSSLTDPTGGMTPTGKGSGTSLSRQLGFIGNVHYTLNEKYTVSGGYRYEANSSMGRNERWGGFPTIGAAWHFGDEIFLKKNAWMSSGKLRVSWGQSGNAPSGSYPYIGAFSALSDTYIGMSAIQPVSIQLDNLKWETVTQTNIGMDVELFEHRLRITTEFYDKLTEDLLHRRVSVPSTTGFSQVSWYNSGSMSNKGFEFITSYDAIKRNDLTVSVNFNIARNVNEVISLPDNLEFENYNFGNGNFAHKILEGNPLGSFYGYRNLGVYQTVEETFARDLDGNIIYDIDGEAVIIQNGPEIVYPGDAKYDDINGDGVINQYDIVYIGNAMPLFTGGGGIDIRYKNVTLTSFFHGRFGQKIVNRTRINTENMHSSNNQSQAVLKRWRREGDNTNIPRALYDKGYNYLGSDRFVEDGSYIRLKSVSLKYSLPKRLINTWGIDRFDIWMTGYDLFTWTDYTGQDPEVGLSSDIYTLSEDRSNTPKPRRYAIGLTLNF